MAGINTYLPKTILNINCINSHPKAQTNKLDQKAGTISLLPTRIPLIIKDRYFWRRGWKKVFQANGPRKQACIAVLTSDKKRL